MKKNLLFSLALIWAFCPISAQKPIILNSTPTPSGMGALDWRRHTELMDIAYRYGLEAIAKRSL